MKKETIRTYIDEDIYISDDGLKRSKSKSEVEDYEEWLEVDKIIKPFELGQLSDEVVTCLQRCRVVEGRVFPQIYRVASYEELNTLVEELEQRYNAEVYTSKLQEYKGKSLEDMRFIFSRYEQDYTANDLNIYDFKELKQDLEDKIKIANEALSTITFWQDEAGKR